MPKQYLYTRSQLLRLQLLLCSQKTFAFRIRTRSQDTFLCQDVCRQYGICLEFQDLFELCCKVPLLARIQTTDLKIYCLLCCLMPQTMFFNGFIRYQGFVIFKDTLFYWIFKIFRKIKENNFFENLFSFHLFEKLRACDVRANKFHDHLKIISL